MNPQTDWPGHEEEHQFLSQLNTGDDRTTHQEVANRYLPLLMRFLATAFPRAHSDLRDEAADRALIDFLGAPHRFDPARSSLGEYLQMAARGDLLNLLERERRARRGIPLDSVAEPDDHRNSTSDEDEMLTFDHPQLVAEVAAFDAHERTAFELLREGVRDTRTCAARLNLTHLPDAEQVRAVKRLKDRVLKRLVRSVEDSQ